MKIAMMGSGGVGGYFGAKLAKGGADVHFIARGRHLAALRSDGLRIEGSNTRRFNVVVSAAGTLRLMRLWASEKAFFTRCCSSSCASAC